MLEARNSLVLPTPPSFEAPAQGNPLEFWDETYPRKTRGMGLLYGENCVILASTIFDCSTRVMDGRTNRRMDGQTELPWHIRAIAYMLSRVIIKIYSAVCDIKELIRNSSTKYYRIMKTDEQNTTKSD